MKRLLYVLLVLATVFNARHAAAQGFLDKMKKFAGNADTLGVMKYSDTLFVDGPGSVIMADGSRQEGTIIYKITPFKEHQTYVMFTPAAEMRPKYFDGDEIKSFTVKGRTFYPVRMKEDDISIGHKTIFMEALNASPDDKFRMYRFRKLSPNSMKGPGEKPYILDKGFYVMLPDFKNAHEIVDITFTPFAKKMSEYLKDCPELAKKIEDKDKGYRYNAFAGAANEEVFMRVMEEYNKCGK